MPTPNVGSSQTRGGSKISPPYPMPTSSFDGTDDFDEDDYYDEEDGDDEE